MTWFRTCQSMTSLLAATLLLGQEAPPLRQIPVPPGFGPRAETPQPTQPAPPPPKPAPAKPGAPAAPGAPPAQATPPASASPVSLGGLTLQNASLVEVIDQFARVLKLNYILDPAVKGGVILNTYGETKQIDPRSMLDMILRINGAAMVQVGDIYRIVPLAQIARLPMRPEVDVKAIPKDDQPMLNMVFLKYATVDELSKLLTPFLGEGSTTFAYPPANLLMILDSHRNMRRTMELIAMFDSDTLASQRIRMLTVEHGRPSDLAKELESVFKAVSLGGKSSAVQFMPINRLNMIVAIAPNPGVFDEVEKWLKKLDIAVEAAVDATDNYVYRVKYGLAPMLAAAIMQLYMGMSGAYGMYGGGYGGMYGGGMYGGGGYGGGMYGGGGYGGGMYGGGGYGGGMYGGGYGGGMYGGGMYGGGTYGGGGYSGMGYAPVMGGFPVGPYIPQTTTATTATTGGAGAAGAGTDQTGTYLGAAGTAGMPRVPRVVPNPMDNTLLIQATPQEYKQILKLLDQLDIPPRQVLIEAKIYEVSLTGAFASGVAAMLQKKGSGDKGATDTRASLNGSLTNGVVALSAATLVGKSRELLAFLSLQENETRSKVIAAPAVIATDSIPASINVGTEVPTLTAQAVTGVQSGGSSLFANTISNRSTGTTLNIMARVNPSGVVTLVINQEVSSPIAPAAGSIQSPSFSKRTVQTQVTVEDGDTIAIGGIILESNASSSAGIPFLHRLPGIGHAFGSRSSSKDRTELIIFMTPRVIYDTNQIAEASDEVRSRLRRLQKLIKE